MARKRFIRIALIPILAPLFLIGWLLAFNGKQKTEAKKPLQRTAKENRKDVLEVGLLSEVEGVPLEAPLESKDAE
ncbi:MAG TPA: hypothetical protein VMD05_04185 [Candidatus Nanoarchaeia archaeon]|nr:hypothetical protein [Candidatus Nanoarchaeia archaeon]